MSRPGVAARRVRVAVACALAGAAAACSTPTPNVAAYQSKAARTASDAVSQLQTVRLATRSAAAGRVTGPYLEVVVGEAEEAYGSIVSTFDGVQPPDDPAADAIRAALDPLLSRGDDAISAARIAVRRGRGTADLDGELAAAVAALDGFDPAAVR